MRRYFAKIALYALVNVSEDKNWNLSPSITILMGFLRISIFGENAHPRYLAVDVHAQKREISDF